MKKILFPLPPLSVQKEIVKHIQSMREQVKELRKSAKENRSKAIIEFEKNIFT